MGTITGWTETAGAAVVATLFQEEFSSSYQKIKSRTYELAGTELLATLSNVDIRRNH